MDLELQNKHVLITGGSKGIGLSCAALFLKEGARVTLVSRSAENLKAAHDALLAEHPTANAKQNIFTFAADLRESQHGLQTLDAAEAHFGNVDILVNSAGAAKRTPLDELTPVAWADAMQAKYFTYIHMIDPTIKRMAKRQSGVVINVVGNGGKVASPIHLPGGAANAALMLATVGLANGYAHLGLRVNAVNPGLTLTDRMHEGFAADARAKGISTDEVLAQSVARLPMGRIATPEEIANAVVFLASSKASYINGICMSMDGALNPIVM
jgi:NAD(P)-dependent dehydrogenase (short-subunit alcohol dehydrogenase family)